MFGKESLQKLIVVDTSTVAATQIVGGRQNGCRHNQASSTIKFEPWIGAKGVLHIRSDKLFSSLIMKRSCQNCNIMVPLSHWLSQGGVNRKNYPPLDQKLSIIIRHERHSS